MCVNTDADWDRKERREFTPVELKHLGLGPKIALLSFLFMLGANLLGLGMLYQKTVDRIDAVEIAVAALPPVTLLESVKTQAENLSSLALTVATQQITIEFMLEDAKDLEREVRALRDRE